MRTLCMLSYVIDESSLPASLTVNLSAGSTAVTSNPTQLATTSPNVSLDSNSPNNSKTTDSKKANISNIKEGSLASAKYKLNRKI